MSAYGMLSSGFHLELTDRHIHTTPDKYGKICTTTDMQPRWLRHLLCSNDTTTTQEHQPHRM